eukprot:SAG22_NODE_563_length_9067_cov_5.039251_9_plen_576_part_00
MDSDEILMLTEMGGWSRDQCRAALALGGSLEAAAELLLGGFQLPDFAAGTIAAAAGGGPGTAAQMMEEVVHAVRRERSRAVGGGDGGGDGEGNEEVEEEDAAAAAADGGSRSEEEDDEQDGLRGEDDDDDDENEEDGEEDDDDDGEETEEKGEGGGAAGDDPVQELLQLLHLDGHPEYLNAALSALDAISTASPEALAKIGIELDHADTLLGFLREESSPDGQPAAAGGQEPGPALAATAPAPAAAAATTAASGAGAAGAAQPAGGGRAQASGPVSPGPPAAVDVDDDLAAAIAMSLDGAEQATTAAAAAVTEEAALAAEPEPAPETEPKLSFQCAAVHTGEAEVVLSGADCTAQRAHPANPPGGACWVLCMMPSCGSEKQSYVEVVVEAISSEVSDAGGSNAAAAAASELSVGEEVAYNHYSGCTIAAFDEGSSPATCSVHVPGVGTRERVPCSQLRSLHDGNNPSAGSIADDRQSEMDERMTIGALHACFTPPPWLCMPLASCPPSPLPPYWCAGVCGFCTLPSIRPVLRAYLAAHLNRCNPAEISMLKDRLAAAEAGEDEEEEEEMRAVFER